MASVLEGFLVRLGFDVDKNSQAKFKESLANGAKAVQSLAVKGLAVGTAFVAGTLKASQSINKFYNFARMNGTSIESVQALEGAFELVGGSATDAQNAVSGIAKTLKTMPNAASKIRSMLGVNVFDRDGKLKDTVKIFDEMRVALSKMDQGMARATAEALGLGSSFDLMMRSDFTEAMARTTEATAAWGGVLSKTSEDVGGLWDEVGLLTSNLKNGLLVASAEFINETGLTSWIKKLNQEFPSTVKNVIASQKEMIKESTGFFDYLGKLFFDSDKYALKGKQAQGQKLTEAEKQALKDYDFERTKTGGQKAADRIELISDESEGVTGDDSVAELIRAKKKKPETKEPIEIIKDNHIDNAEPVKKQTVKAEKKKPVEVAKTEQVTAPVTTNPTQIKSEQIKPVQIKPVQKEKRYEMPQFSKAQAQTVPTVVTKPQPMPVAQKQVAAPAYNPRAAQSDAASMARSKGVGDVTNNRTNNITVTQTLNFNGSPNPQEVGRIVKSETERAMARNVVSPLRM